MTDNRYRDITGGLLDIGQNIIMERAKLDRLSELTRISRERELIPAEKQEREALRNEYRQSVVGNLTSQLEHMTIIEPDGTKIKVSDLKNTGEGK